MTKPACSLRLLCVGVVWFRPQSAMRFWIYALLLSPTTLAWAAPAATASPADEPTVEQVLIRDLDHETDVDPKEARTLTDLLTAHFSNEKGFQTISSEDIRELLELESDRQAVDCFEGEACLQEIAGAMGARFVVHGRINRLGSMLLLHLNLFDAQAGLPIAREMVQGETLASFAQSLPPAAANLSNAIREQLRKEGRLVTGPAASDDSSASANDSAAEEGAGMGVMAFVPWGVAGVGLVAGLSGIGVAVGSAVAGNLLDSPGASQAELATIYMYMNAGFAGGVGIMLVGVGVGIGGAIWGLLSGDE